MLLPTIATEQKAPLRQRPGRLKKEGMHARLPVRQAVAQKPKRAGKARLRRHRIMRGGIQGIVYWHTGAGAERQVGVDHWSTAAVGTDQIVLGNALAKGI